MKITNRIFFIAFAVFVLICCGVLTAARVAVLRATDIRPLTDEELEVVVLEYDDLKDFSRLTVSGYWEVNLTAAQDYAVTVAVPRYFRDNVVIEQTGQTLAIELLEGTHINLRGGHHVVNVELPQLTALRLKGGMSITLEDFDSPSLDIHNQGLVLVYGNDCTIENLYADLEGVSTLNLIDCSITNADFNIEGTGSGDITLNGGKLSGTISGTFALTYYGEATSTLDTEGLASVSHKRR